MRDSLSLRLLDVLRHSSGEVPIDYLISKLDTTRSELESRIARLEQEGVIMTRGPRVSLAERRGWFS